MSAQRKWFVQDVVDVGQVVFLSRSALEVHLAAKRAKALLGRFLRAERRLAAVRAAGADTAHACFFVAGWRVAHRLAVLNLKKVCEENGIVTP